MCALHVSYLHTARQKKDTERIPPPSFKNTSPAGLVKHSYSRAPDLYFEISGELRKLLSNFRTCKLHCANEQLANIGTVSDVLALPSRTCCSTASNMRRVRVACSSKETHVSRFSSTSCTNVLKRVLVISHVANVSPQWPLATRFTLHLHMITWKTLNHGILRHAPHLTRHHSERSLAFSAVIVGAIHAKPSPLGTSPELPRPSWPWIGILIASCSTVAWRTVCTVAPLAYQNLGRSWLLRTQRIHKQTEEPSGVPCGVPHP